LLARRPSEPTLVALTLIALATTVGEPRAVAAPTDAEITQARERFAEARRLEEAGRWAEALALLQRVAEVKTTPQVRFHVALAMEHVGLWTQALDGYAQAKIEAGSAAPDVVREADEHLARLTQVIPTVSLHVAGAAAGDVLLLDRQRLPIDDRPLPVRADPGAHTAEVRRGGALLAREYFAVEARSTRRIELRVGSIAPEPPDPGKGSDPSAPHGPGPDPAPGDPTPRVPPIVVPPEPRLVPRALGWTAIGLGGASLTAMGVFIGERASALASVTAACPSLTHCPTSVAPTVSAGKTDAVVVNVTAVAGGVLAATGIVLLVVASHGAAPPAAAPPPVTAWIGIRPAGLAIGGVFQ
jgi:hypothetical protein